MVGNKRRAAVTARSGRQPATAALVLSEGKSSSPSEGPCPGLAPAPHPAGGSSVWCLLRLVVSGSPGLCVGSVKVWARLPGPWEDVLPHARAVL